DNDRKFKKEYQTIGRPTVADHDINDEYVRRPPMNEPTGPTTDRKVPGLKEGAREITDPKVEGVLGDQPIGKLLPDIARAGLIQENTVH
ncbi:hypothetical protein OBBRIDRAFT_691303, partial [Obba rivulosa]